MKILYDESLNDRGKLYRAILWVFVMLISFLTMAVAARELSNTFNAFQIIFFRTITAFVIVVIFIAPSFPRTIMIRRVKIQIFRNVIHYCGNLAWIIGVGLIPLAQVFALEFTIPIWVAMMAVFFLKEEMTIGKLVAIAFGFAGVLVVLRPGLVTIEIGSISVLIASLAFAIAFVITKSLTEDNSPLAILFWMFGMQLPISAIGGIYLWITPEWSHLPWIICIGTTALTAHYSMVRALALADVTVILPIDFIRMPLIAVIGFFFYAEPFSIWIFFGAILIFTGNYFNIYFEHKKLRN